MQMKNVYINLIIIGREVHLFITQMIRKNPVFRERMKRKTIIGKVYGSIKMEWGGTVLAFDANCLPALTH